MLQGIARGFGFQGIIKQMTSTKGYFSFNFATLLLPRRPGTNFQLREM